MTVAVAAGVGVVIGCVIFTASTLFGRAIGASDRTYSFDECRNEAERALLLEGVDVHTARLRRMRNEYARQVGAPERR